MVYISQQAVLCRWCYLSSVLCRWCYLSSVLCRWRYLSSVLCRWRYLTSVLCRWCYLSSNKLTPHSHTSLYSKHLNLYSSLYMFSCPSPPMPFSYHSRPPPPPRNPPTQVLYMYPVSISSQHNYSHSSTHCLPPDTDMTLLLSVHSWIWQSHSTFSTRLTGCATAVTWSWWNVPVLHHTTVSSTKCGRISSFEVQSNMLWISFHSTFSHHPTKKTIKDLKKSLKSQNPFFKKTKRRRKEHKKTISARVFCRRL